MIALSYSPSIDVARSALEALAQPDVRAAAIGLLERMAADLDVSCDAGHAGRR
jgi:hypothetical protein